ncbi:unnamed protein product [Rotaria sp. Silwood1]|nr:unnamed protein product [Rotaria sp. Silwood1]
MVLFGEIISCKWTNTDQTEALFTFAHYDSVDKIILRNLSPEIKGAKISLERTRTAEDYIAHELSYVIHVTNLPFRVTSEEISKVFKVPIGVILLYPCFRLEQSRIVDGRSSSEARITNFTNEKLAQSLAQEKTGMLIGTNKIQCEVMLESINDEELCERFQKCQCPYSTDTCYYKHITCYEPDTCDDKSCWLGHSDKRTTISNNNRPQYRSEDAPYRVKISNLPSNITHEDLMKRLKIHPKSSHHLILQPAEQCSEFHHRQPPSDISSWSTRWQWTNQMIPKEESDCDVLYWLESESVKEKNIVIKIYLPQTNQTARIRAQREQIALERLKQLICVPKLLRSNVHSANDDQSNKEFWNIMRFTDAERLSDYVKNNKADLREALKIAQQLLTIIKQIHAQNIIHRDIQPKNILVQYRSNSDEISLILMNFSSAWINNYQWANSEENIDVELGNSFYQMPQFEKRQNENNDEQLREYQCSPKIDTTGVCAILFWLITNHEPKESKNIDKQAPHKLRVNSKFIEKRINEATAFRVGTKIPEHIMKHLTLIFDRGFGDPNQQWSVDELDYQLQFMFTLITNENEQVNYFPAPQIMNDIILSPTIPLEDPFVYVVSLIHHLKHQFATRYSKCVRWSTDKKNSWNAQNGRIENYDLLIFSCQEKNFPIDIKWDVQLLQEQNFLFYVKARTDNKIIIELPLGVWKINEQTATFEVHLQNFEMEIKTLINILFKSNVH